MSWTVSGITWTPQTAATHAQTQLDYLNALQQALVPPGPTLTASPTNAIWLEYLGSGSIQQLYDDKLYAASQSFNVATCDDTQVLNLAPIAGTAPLAATYSTVYLTCVATSSGTCIIPAGTKAQFGAYNFVTALPTTIGASASASVFCVCDIPGPILAPSGSMSSFTTTITNLASVSQSSNSTQEATRNHFIIPSKTHCRSRNSQLGPSGMHPSPSSIAGYCYRPGVFQRRYNHAASAYRWIHHPSKVC